MPPDRRSRDSRSVRTFSSPSSSTNRVRASSGSRDGASAMSATATGGVGRGTSPAPSTGSGGRPWAPCCSGRRARWRRRGRRAPALDREFRLLGHGYSLPVLPGDSLLPGRRAADLARPRRGRGRRRRGGRRGDRRGGRAGRGQPRPVGGAAGARPTSPPAPAGGRRSSSTAACGTWRTARSGWRGRAPASAPSSWGRRRRTWCGRLPFLVPDEAGRDVTALAAAGGHLGDAVRLSVPAGGDRCRRPIGSVRTRSRAWSPACGRAAVASSSGTGSCGRRPAGRRDRPHRRGVRGPDPDRGLGDRGRRRRRARGRRGSEAVTLRARVVVNAAGVWAQRLAPGIRLQPSRGRTSSSAATGSVRRRPR